ncbi:Hsp20/alpha crystallin family protein [Aciduricibacillus chroicocephali]|uniref:Hsp20/alpha crystallin family protein n=1 Tax=Aciduricibacillus chroicocephali TaxID=3054939 RepID=A0ABY9L003_9BACI|nr:Hsp20/alpha crystallin family protein [Bacillaceae bacterium 44XB]
MALIPGRGTKEANDYSERFTDYFGGFPPFNISAFLDNKKVQVPVPVPVELLADIYEEEDSVIALCDLPGIAKKEDILIDIIDERHLKISAVRDPGTEFEGKRVAQKERSVGRIERTITLPADVLIDKTQAGYKNGVLRVTMPKKTKGLEQKIDIKFED